MRRVDSYARKYSEEDIYNKNVEWMKEPFAWVFYPLSIVGTFFAVMILMDGSVATALTVTNLLHGVFTFALLHWVKGSPDFYDQGVYNGLTLWEQIEPTGDWDATKKYLTLVPTLLLLATLVASDYDSKGMALNIPVWAVLVVGKLPAMYRVRIFGINSTPGIDDEDDETDKTK
mmetsp:Transcript_67544/g.152859  ORF Transcript_67544/g.152859 Transcript_67544/m.152859 type:complete len:174 (+) Transcript_67544:187-708(+)|eukprot:CAMPEP_0172592910 /NCGR_PEP_ID=MMETSP1068-20121228/12043_1 /TAXON_ID=35684 /ORGANISM="Pseudopedinella elastica, Strain CCMP716" /LENGTH=173 /DNA_ID=CAMNT_0013390185 /DNA_START=186 /DNA_END=707 /DNA_ORIENTATION=-